MAIFLPTSRIPDLGHILRHEVDEAQRWRYFENIALGTSSLDPERAAAIVRRSGGSLDRESLWSGLYAARIFDWHGSHFWMLFLADVQRKLIASVNYPGDIPRSTGLLLPGAFGWRHAEWEVAAVADASTHSRLVPLAHDDVEQSMPATVPVGVRSAGAKASPLSVAVSPPDDETLLSPTRAELTEGAAVAK